MIVTPDSLNFAGCFFHSIKDGRIEWQGQVLFALAAQPGWYFIELYDWRLAIPNFCRLAELSEMKDWLFYTSYESMRESYLHGVARPGGPYRPKESE